MSLHAGWRLLWKSAAGPAWVGRHVIGQSCLPGQVSVEDARKAMVEQYGGEDEGAPPGAGFNTFKFTKYSNAYMLVYVRKSDWDQVRCPAAMRLMAHSYKHHVLCLHAPTLCTVLQKMH